MTTPSDPSPGAVLGDPSLVVGVIGAGTMGAGIAEVAARAGHSVRLLDAAEGASDRAIEGISGRLTRDVDRGRTTEVDATDVAARLVSVGAVAGLAGCGLVIEAVAEDLPVKRTLLSAVEDVVDKDAVLATNTSSLSVTAVAAGLRNPPRVVGLHFFNPAPRMRLVEVVHGDETAPRLVDAAMELVRRWGKTPVRCTSTPGFIVNRVARPFYGEAQRLVEERAATPEVVDRVLREAGGFPMGPLELTDLVGQDVNLAVSRSVWQQTFHDPRYAPTGFQQRLVDAGRLGRKSGRGVYRYDGAGHAPVDTRPAPPTADVRIDGQVTGWSVMTPLAERIEAAQGTTAGTGAGATSDIGSGALLPSGGRLMETTGVPAFELGDQVVVLDWAHSPGSTERVAIAPSPTCSDATVAEAVGLLRSAGVEADVVGDVAGVVVARTLAMLVNEAADLVARGEATADDVDTAMRLGTGYPLGPLEWGELLGTDRVLQVLSNLHEAYPTGRYRPCPALRRAAATGAPLRG